MKVAIVYYSLSAFTQRVSEWLKENLANRGSVVDVFRINKLGPEGGILRHFIDNILGHRAPLENIKTDMEEYDLLFIGSCDFNFSTPPALRTYLDKLNGVLGKRVGLFVVHRKTDDRVRSIEKIEEMVRSKGALKTSRFLTTGEEIDNDSDSIKRELDIFVKDLIK